MDKELESYYEERFSMTASKGWQQLMEDVDKMIEAVSSIINVNKEASLDFRKGQLDILLWMKNLRAQAEETHRQLKLFDEDEDESV